MSEKDKRTQKQKFIDMAKELGCDDDEKAFKDKLRKVATHKTDKKEKPAD